jgi:hypothetical protein
MKSNNKMFDTANKVNKLFETVTALRNQIYLSL